MKELRVPGLDVSRETVEQLELYGALLDKWTRRINLIAPSTTDDLWDRHIRDSAQLRPLAGHGTSWLDLGSGGGLPGIVLSIIDPTLSVTLVESDTRKCAFLQTVRRELGLTFEVINARAEAIPPAHAEIVTARAMAPLPDLLGHAHTHLGPGGTAIFPKGRQAAAELAAARASWDFALTEFPSITDPSARILKIERLRRV